MTSTIPLSADLALPLDAVTRTFGLLAVRGAGKSNTAAVMAEGMFDAGLPFVVVDPVGSWFGLRSSSDGQAPGLPIPIFGGKHGDIPLERGGGELVADLIVDKRLSCVLDLSGFDSEGDKKHFLLAFARRLYAKNENPLHLFLEEADDYIPQKPMREEAQLLRAFENIVRRGRARGLGMTFITQRSAVINKNVLTQVETLIVMRTTGPQDRDAVEAWVKYHQAGRDVLPTLASLKDGEAWVWSPHFLGRMERIQIRRRRTFDSGATPKNVRSGDARPAATLADVDLAALKVSMSATIERAKADDPRELRKRIGVLERELAQVHRDHTAEQPAPERVEVPVVTAEQLAELARLVEALDAAAATADDISDKAVATAAALRSDLAKVHQHPPAPARPAPTVRVEPPRHTVERTLDRLATAPRPAAGAGDVGKGGLQRILIALAQRPQGLSTAQIGVRARLSSTSGTFDTYLSRARQAGWVEGDRARLTITRAGLAALGRFTPLPTGRELLEHWLQELGQSGAARMLSALADAYPRALSKAALGQAANISSTSGTFDTYLSRLRRLELVEGKTELRASEELFA